MIIVTANLGLLSFPSEGQLHQARCPLHRKHEFTALVWPAAKLGVVDCARDCIRFRVPQPTERQRIGNQIDAAMIFARAAARAELW